MTEYLAFQCRSRLCLWCKHARDIEYALVFKFQCRTRLCWWCKLDSEIGRAVAQPVFQCRTRLCLWCKVLFKKANELEIPFQCRTRLCWWCKDCSNRWSWRNQVSMPHAALLVVQERYPTDQRVSPRSFNAARGFVCGASQNMLVMWLGSAGFNAARGFVCGARSFAPMFPGQVDVSMPLAALFVVQVLLNVGYGYNGWFQCRSRLCLWCKPI